MDLHHLRAIRNGLPFVGMPALNGLDHRRIPEDGSEHLAAMG
jgi:hypothetical protein